MANFKLKGCIFNENGTVISAPADTTVEAIDTTFSRNQTVFDIRDDVPKEILDLFHPDVPKVHLQDLLRSIQTIDSPTPEPIARRLQETGLSKWIANGANVVTVATAIIQFAQYLNR